MTPNSTSYKDKWYKETIIILHIQLHKCPSHNKANKMAVFTAYCKRWDDKLSS